MPFLRLFSFILAVFSGTGAFRAFAQVSIAPQIQQEVRVFQKMVDRVLREEPELIHNSKGVAQDRDSRHS